jgi:hypothetical protein
MSSEVAISKTSSPITMLESTERVNEGADPADEEAIPADEGAKQVRKVAERGSEATKPTDEGAEQANEAADQTESLEAGAAPTTPLQILRTFTEIENAPENATK